MKPLHILKIVLHCLIILCVESGTNHFQDCVDKTCCEYKEDANYPEMFDVICNIAEPKIVQKMLYCFDSAKDGKKLNKISLSSSTVLEQGMLERLDTFWLDLTNVSVLPESTFKGVKSVKYISLRRGNLTEVPPSVLGLNFLRYLEITDFNFKTLPDFVFLHMSSLNQLCLKQCSIFKIHRSAFYGLQNLKKLRLPENNLTAVPTDALAHLPTFYHLDLSYNQISELGVNAFINLSSIEILYLSGNRLSSISSRSFLGLPGLMNLFLDRNNISYFHKEAFAGLNKLRSIDLSENPLIFVDPDVMSHLATVHTLKLRRTQITAIQEQSFTCLKKLDKLDLAENNLKYVPTEAIRNLSKLKWLDLRKNSITELKPNAFAGLRKLESSENPGSGIGLKNETIFGFRSLYSLEINCNQITELKNDTFLGLRYKQLQLNLTNNQISVVQTLAFAGIRGSLRYLFLEGNRLTRVPVEALQNMTLLEHLSLGSFIEYIEADTFKSFGESIKLISLQGNKITSFAASAFHHLPSLRELYLGNNQIHHLDFYPFRHIINDLTHLEIKGNPLKCDCELYWYTVVNWWNLEYQFNDFHMLYNVTLGVCTQEKVSFLNQECKQKWKPILCNATSLYDCMYVDFCLKDPACCDQETYDETKVCIKI